MAWLPLTGVLGWPLLLLLVEIVGKAIFPTASKNLIAAVAFLVSNTFFVICIGSSLKFQQEYPINKKRASPIDHSQFALAPTDARFRLKNDRDIVELVASAIHFSIFVLVIARDLSSPILNLRKIEFCGVFAAILLVMGLNALRRLRRYPLRFEAFADAEGLTIRKMRRQPEHFAWHEIQEASLVEEFADSGARASLSLVLLSANNGKPVASVPLSSFKAEDAARFQSVVAHYLKPPSAS